MGGYSGAEEVDAIVYNSAEIGDEGADARGAAVTWEIEGEAGEAEAGEVDGGVLEGPADVVAVPVYHEDGGARRRNRHPGSGEEGCAVGRSKERFGGVDAMRSVELFFRRRRVSPEI